MHVIGIDVGGTSIKAVRLGHTAEVVATARGATPRADATGQRTVAAVADLVTRLRSTGVTGDVAADDVRAVGLVVPGIVDEFSGRSVFAGNLGWRDLPLRDLLAEACGLPVVFGHDVRAGGLAEARLGAARGRRSALVVPVGTGIAAALVLDGRPFAGRGHAGELGHIVVDEGGEQCACGRRGCVETVASAAALARRYSARAGEPVTGAAEVVARMEVGDQLAHQVWREGVTALARALDAATTLLDPEVVVLGGGLARAGSRLADDVRAQLADRLTFQPVPEVTIAQLGDEAGSLGAALLALDRWGPDVTASGRVAQPPTRAT